MARLISAAKQCRGSSQNSEGSGKLWSLQITLFGDIDTV